MRMFNFTVTNCKNCNKCVRECPVNAIKFVDSRVEIDEDKCIACGICFKTCPKNARNVENDVKRLEKAISEGKTVVACLDSAYIGVYEDASKFVAALKEIGFKSIQEAASASERLTEEYLKYFEENAGTQKYFISSGCPALYLYVEKYHPKLIPYVIPIDTSIKATAKAIKKEMPDSLVAYVGPCLSEKHELLSEEKNPTLDYYITFREIDNIIKRRNIDMESLEGKVPDRTAQSTGGSYSIAGDMRQSLKEMTRSKGYDVLRVDGMDKIKNIFSSLEKGNLENCYISASVCVESCINGPFVPKNAPELFCRKQKIEKFAQKGWDKKGPAFDWSNINVKKKFEMKDPKRKIATNKEIEEILKKMGRRVKYDEFDCGSCGYASCREKAQAVFEGMADIEMCWPYLREKAKRKGDTIFENSRNIIIMLDKNLNIMQINPVAEKKFRKIDMEVHGQHISSLDIDTKDFEEAMKEKKDILNKKMVFSNYGIIAMCNTIYIEGDELFVSMQDVTEEEKRKVELAKLKNNSVLIAQNVIEKQMRVAQEIASLLGETTAETKVALNKLKEVVSKEEVD